MATFPALAGIAHVRVFFVLGSLWHAEHIGKGWPVLISLAAVGAAATLVSIWWGTARFFRRRFQLTRRAWLTFIVAVAISCGWYAAAIVAAQAQAALYNELSVGLGTIQYDPEVVLPENPLDGLMGPGFFATPILTAFATGRSMIGWLMKLTSNHRPMSYPIAAPRAFI